MENNNPSEVLLALLISDATMIAMLNLTCRTLSQVMSGDSKDAYDKNSAQSLAQWANGVWDVKCSGQLCLSLNANSHCLDFHISL